ncbi:gliding motility-associated C-terminal domain-containing protein [Chitinophaga pinensis]|uniref:Gliding motility-associated C-terminal domain-containing protein n=2 Tax=Chitinophaga pinensis TaxID=79329 RepID=A0A5C6LP41_9BACT|nr:gliding motility-associated C-terminal domain-containing protein [Chitinophaga pinensis]
MSIFDRWGQLIYSGKDMTDGWRGDFKGLPVPVGTYLWMITYTDGRQQARKQTGSVTVIR